MPKIPATPARARKRRGLPNPENVAWLARALAAQREAEAAATEHDKPQETTED